MPNKITNPIFIMFMAIFIGTAGIFASDMYLPSLPAITHVFHASTTDVQWTITVYLFGLAVSQLFYGPLSDRIGRRKTCILGISICLIGSFICIFSFSIAMLLFGRMIQAFGAGAGAALSRTILRDVFSGKTLVKVVSYNSIIFSLAPAAAPILGGYIEDIFGWRCNFIFISLYIFFALILIIFFMPETNRFLNPRATRFEVVLKNYLTLLSSKIFIGYVLIGSLVFSGVIAYITASPFLFQIVLHLTPVQYGWLAVYIMLASMCGKLTNIFLLNYFSMHTNMVLGMIGMIGAGITMLLIALTGTMNVYVIILPTMFYIFSGGLVSTNAAAGGFMPFASIAGATGAMYGCLQLFSASISSGIMAGLHEKTQLPLALIFISIGIISCVVFSLFILSKHFNPEIEEEHDLAFHAGTK